MTEQDKLIELGIRAKVLLRLHLEDTKIFNAEHILNNLFDLYERFEFDIEQKKSS